MRTLNIVFDIFYYNIGHFYYFFIIIIIISFLIIIIEINFLLKVIIFWIFSDVKHFFNR